MDCDRIQRSLIKLFLMEKGEQHIKLRSISVDVERGRPISKRKYTKNVGSELIPRRTELKIIRLDEQILSSPSKFGEDNIPLFKRANRKPSKRTHVEQRKTAYIHKELVKARYQDLFREHQDLFGIDTMQIGPCAKSINTECELTDMYARRKLINIEKLTFPYRQAKRQVSTRHKYRTLMNKTSRTQSNRNSASIKDHRNKSFLEHRQLSQRSNNKEIEVNTSSDFKLMLNSEPKDDYKKQITTLIPIRKPSNKKDYFVFGLSDKNNTPENKIQMYRDLLWKINYSNGLYVITPESMNSPYKFYIGEGNNSNLIRGIMRRRFWWIQASSKNQEGLNFSWTQLKTNSFFSTQQKAISSEYFVIERVQTSVSSQNMVFCKDSESDSNKRIFGRLDYKIWRHHLQKNEKSEKKINETTYQKRVKMYEKKRMLKVEDSKNIKMHNHLQSNFYIGNKKALYYNLKRYLQLKGEDPFQMLPLTFHINKGIDDPEYQRFLKCYQSIQEEKRNKKNIKNVWIVKPGENTNRGNGITVCYSLDDIKLRLKGRERNGDGKLRTFILQKYIENPLLYNKRKFDLRHYVLITCINGSFKGYWYEQGYVRTSSNEFNIKSSKDSMIHLTNDAVQKYSPDFGKYEKANKLSYADLHKYIESAFPSKKVNFFEEIIPKMKHFAIEAIKATYFILDPNRRTHNFELLGLDFMIDENFQPWLIEVNTNPCLELVCPLLQRLVPSVVENTFRICIDPLFPPPEGWPVNRKPFFGQDPIGDNKFQIIFDENCDGKDVERLLKGKQKLDQKMGKIEQDDETFQNDGEVDWQKE